MVVLQFSSVTQSCLLFATPWPQHARPPCPSPTPGVHPNPCPLSRWCHPTISSPVIPFSSCPQSFPASGSFLRCAFPFQHLELFVKLHTHTHTHTLAHTDGILWGDCFGSVDQFGEKYWIPAWNNNFYPLHLSRSLISSSIIIICIKILHIFWWIYS